VSVNAGGNVLSDSPSNAITKPLWYFYAVTWNGNTLQLFRGSQTVVASSVASVSLNSYSPTSGTLTLLPSVTGSVDDVRIFSAAFQAAQGANPGQYGVPDLWSNTNAGAAPTGAAPLNPAYYGHYGYAEIDFASNIASGSTGQITVTGYFSDISFGYGQILEFILYGCTASSYPTIQIAADGTTASFAKNYKLIISLGANAATISAGQTFTYVIPATIGISNPSPQLAATSSDPRWQAAIYNAKSPSGVTQGTNWQGITLTPATSTSTASL